jgi:hypothetical protein
MSTLGYQIIIAGLILIIVGLLFTIQHLLNNSIEDGKTINKLLNMCLKLMDKEEIQ